MGIRVHKAIGWATRKAKISNETMEMLYEMSYPKFTEWLRENKDAVSAAIPKIKDPRYTQASPLSSVDFYLSCAPTRSVIPHSMGRCVMHDPEFGLKRLTLFIDPLEFKTWFRYDSTLDWIEETERHSQRPRFHKVTRGLYPYALGQISPGVVGLCILAGVPEIIPSLHEGLYVYWG
jgi:hypothetical protein